MLRKTIIVVALAAALPSPPQEAGEAQPVAMASVFEYVGAATQTVADLRGFCARNANVCVTANALAATMEAKAKYSAKLIYEWANEAGGTNAEQALAPFPADLAAFDDLTTSVAPKGVRLAESQSTLTLDDLLPEWRQPRENPAKVD